MSEEVPVPTWMSSLLDADPAPVPAAPPVLQDATQMNAVLEMMAQAGQFDQVIHLFGQFGTAGVMPDLDTYRVVTRACAELGMFQCIEVLLRACEQQQLSSEELLPHCLQAAAQERSGQYADAGFVLAWAPRCLAKDLAVPAACVRLLLEDRAQSSGLDVAVKLYQELVAAGSDPEACAQALKHAAAGIVDQEHFVGGFQPRTRADQTPQRGAIGQVGAMGAGVTPLRAPHGSQAVEVTPEKLTPEKPKPPPGLACPAHLEDEEWLDAEKNGDADKAFRLYAANKGPQQRAKLFTCLATAARMPGQDPRDILTQLEKVVGPLDVPAYNIVVAAVASKGKLDQVEKLIEEMKAKHLQPDADTMNALLDACARTGRGEKGWALLTQMLKQGMRADKYPVSLLLKGVNDKGDRAKTRRGVELVERLLEQQPQVADDVLFNSLLDACCRLRDVPRLHRTLQRMRQARVKPSAATFGTLLKAYGQQKDGDNVLRVWEEMLEAGVGVNPVTYGCMLDACVKCDFFDLAEDVFNEMKKVGMHRNTILYTTVIKGCARQKKLKKAQAIMHEMKAEGVLLNHVTYNSLIDTAIRCRDLPAATKLLETMRNDRIQPDLITYSTLMKGFCDQGDLQVALNLYSKLQEQGMKPDEIMYNSLLEGCVKAGQAQAGLNLFEEMLQSQVTPSNITFSILVKLYARMDRLDQALDVVQQMEKVFRVKPTSVVFTALVKCCVASNRLAVAANLLLGLPQAAGVQPDGQMYAAVLPGLATPGNLELGLEVLEQYAAACAMPRQVFDQAQRMFQACGRIGSFAVKEQARALATKLAQSRLLSPDHAESLAALLGPKGWQGTEFVPGQLWEGQAWSQGFVQSPSRKGRQADENAPPNGGLQMLQIDEGHKGTRRGARRPLVSPGSGRKAPLVAKGAFTSQPLEYTATPSGSPTGR